MILRWIGALLIMIGCGGFGFAMARNYKKQEKSLRQLIRALDFFSCELSCRLTPLPDICRKISESDSSSVGGVFSTLEKELGSQIFSDVINCMEVALGAVPDISTKCCALLRQLGMTLGQYDTEGQLSEIAAVKVECVRELESICVQRDVRIRNYQTLGLCAGAALAILLI